MRFFIKKLAIVLLVFMVVLLFLAITAYAEGTGMTPVGRGIWWLLTAVFALLMAYLNFSKKHQGTIPAKLMIIINVASVVFGVIFATPWIPPAGP